MDSVYLDLPEIQSSEMPEEYQYKANNKPYRFNRIYKTDDGTNFGKDEKIRIHRGDTNKPM